MKKSSPGSTQLPTSRHLLSPSQPLIVTSVTYIHTSNDRLWGPLAYGLGAIIACGAPWPTALGAKTFLASLLAVLPDGSREGFWASRLSSSYSPFEASFVVFGWSPRRWRCCVSFWWCGASALVCSQVLPSPTPPPPALVFWDGLLGTGATGHFLPPLRCFASVDVVYPLCGLPGHLMVVVMLLVTFHFALVAPSSCPWTTTFHGPIAVGAGLDKSSFSSGWCVLCHHRFMAVFVWESLEWQCRVAWWLDW